MKHARQTLMLTAALGAGLIAASAFAQQPASPPPPSAPPSAQTQVDAPPSNAAARGPRGLSSEDRAAFFDARIAAVHAGLRLTPDQEKLWPPVESAVRDMARQIMEMRGQRQTQAAPADPVERMARMGDASTKRGQALTRLAEAARPLYASLGDDQKRRLRVLMRHPGRDDRGRGMSGRGMMDRGMMDRDMVDRDMARGPQDRRHDRMGRHDHGDMNGVRDGERRRGSADRDDDRRGGRWNDFR